MIELNDFNISQLELKNLPSDKRLKYIMHGNIYQYESEFSINGIFIDDDKNYYLSFLPFKGLSAFPLGTIFEDMKVTDKNVLQNIIDVKITLNPKLTGFNKIGDIDVLREKFETIPDEISGYTGQIKTILNQLVAVYKDQISGKTLYIPHYEIARWYYIRSSSMCRQVLSANLEGLYYEANHLDTAHKEAELIMKHGSSNGDAPDVFRFAKDNFANIMFHNFSLDLAANKSNYNKKKNHQTTKIRANFPVHGDLNLKIKGFPLKDKSIFVYQFIEEDSLYPFDELNVYRYGSNNKREIEAIINKKSPNKEEVRNQIGENTPSSDYESQTAKNNVVVNELRKGLEGKKIKFKPMLKPSEDNDSIIEHKVQVSGIDLALSLGDASKSGDGNLVHTSLVNKAIEQEEKFVERENNLTVFKRMVFKLIDKDKGSKEPKGLSINIVTHANLPRKPKDYTGKAKWGKSDLEDGRPRQYIIVEITLGKQIFYVIEIEKSNEKEKIAIAILYQKSCVLHVNRLYDIARDYVQHNGTWMFGDNVNNFYMHHTGSDNDMAKRLYKRISEV